MGLVTFKPDCISFMILFRYNFQPFSQQCLLFLFFLKILISLWLMNTKAGMNSFSPWHMTYGQLGPRGGYAEFIFFLNGINYTQIGTLLNTADTLLHFSVTKKVLATCCLSLTGLSICKFCCGVFKQRTKLQQLLPYNARGGQMQCGILYTVTCAAPLAFQS